MTVRKTVEGSKLLKVWDDITSSLAHFCWA